MKQSIGLDIVDLNRVSRLLERYGNRFINRIVSEDEQVIFSQRPDKVAFLAGRFAAKEATIKALSAFRRVRPPLKELSVLPDENGMPSLHLRGSLAQDMSGITSMISISHDRTSAVAMVVMGEV